MYHDMTTPSTDRNHTHTHEREHKPPHKDVRARDRMRIETSETHLFNLCFQARNLRVRSTRQSILQKLECPVVGWLFWLFVQIDKTCRQMGSQCCQYTRRKTMSVFDNINVLCVRVGTNTRRVVFFMTMVLHACLLYRFTNKVSPVVCTLSPFVSASMTPCFSRYTLYSSFFC